MKKLKLTSIFLISVLGVFSQTEVPQLKWEHFSTKQGDVNGPNGSEQQTSCLVMDIDKDGINDFIVTERVQAPAVSWFKKNGNKWDRYILDADQLKIEAGSTFYDIDNDGDLDPVFGGEYSCNEVWWWENPYPNYDPNTPWKRHTIKKSGVGKHHDQLIADFDGDGLGELVFWNQRINTLFFAEIPENPREKEEWDFKPIYTYTEDGQMPFPGEVPWWKMPNEHEGLEKADIDMDGVLDIIGGGWWFKHLGNGNFSANVIDASYTFSRPAAGQLIEGGRPEVILVVGDGLAPMYLYEWKNGSWVPKKLIDMVDNGHSLDIIDFNGDGHLDIFNAEMRFSAEHNSSAKCRVLLGDGKGNFTDYIINEGFSHHESKIADLDGDGDYDILSKPYAHLAPGVDIWLQNGTGDPLSLADGVHFDKPVGLQLYSLRHEFEKDVPGTLKKIRDMGFNHVELSGYYNYSPKEFKDLLKTNKLAVSSIIFNFDRFVNDLAGISREAKLFGTKYVGIGWLPHKYMAFNLDTARFAIEKMNEFAANLKKQGIKFFYHLHGYEFGNTGEMPMISYFMENLSEDVLIELDAMWALYSGTDPVWFMKKYGSRVKLLHMKDLRWGTGPVHTGGAPDPTSVPLGQGQVNFPAILRLAKQIETEIFVIEDEAADAFMQIPQSLQYISKLR